MDGLLLIAAKFGHTRPAASRRSRGTGGRLYRDIAVPLRAALRFRLDCWS